MKNKFLSILIASFFVLLQTMAQIPLNGLIAYYPFNGNAYDQSGNNFNGFVNGASLTSDRFGNINSAYYFNGTSDFIGVSDNSVLRLGNTDFTISVWINETSRASTQESIISKRSAAGGNGYILNIEGSVQPTPGLSNFHVSGGLDPRAFSSSIVQLNTWKHIVIAYNVSLQTVKTYLDGVLDNFTVGMPSPNSATSVAMKIGTDAAGNAYYFHGKIDDIRIYNRELSDTEIDSLFNESNSVSAGLVDSFNSNSISIHPNPTNGLITIETNNISCLRCCQMEIVDSFGRQVYQSAIVNEKNIVDLSKITTKGIYYVFLINSEGFVVQSSKLIIN